MLGVEKYYDKVTSPFLHFTPMISHLWFVTLAKVTTTLYSPAVLKDLGSMFLKMSSIPSITTCKSPVISF